jgi:hypothetical protein
MCPESDEVSALRREWIEGKSLDELLGSLVGTAEVGSPVYEQIRAAIDVEIAKMQREAGDKAAKDALKWARVSAVAAAASATIAVVALLVATL